MILMPEDYHSLELGINSKRLVTILKNKLGEQWIVILGINPIGNKKCIDFGVINTERGLLCIDVDEAKEPKGLVPYIKMMIPLWQKSKGKLYEKLIFHRLLKQNNVLKFMLNWAIFFPNIRRQDIPDIENDEGLQLFVEKCCLFSNELFQNVELETMLLNSMDNIGLPCQTRKEPFTEDELNVIIQQIAPEYTIPRYILFDKNDIKVERKDISYRDTTLNENEVYIRALRLDFNQVNIVNNLRSGHQLILACAGSGKSVLLISKAFKIASIYPDKNVLITCYNRNLAHYYNWSIDVAGFKERNVVCKSFFSLCKELLDRNKINYRKMNSFTVNDFDYLFAIAQKAVYDGQIKERFYAIFIDEVQIFKPEWYKFCYSLLENKTDGDYVFVICGDKSQNVNDNIEKGLAPWQTSDLKFPDYTNSTIRIEKNYRNSIPINHFINRFISESKKYFDILDVKIQSDPDLFLRGQAIREGIEPKVVKSNRFNEKTEVINAIKVLNIKYKVPHSDIAVIFYNTKYNPLRYFPLKWLEDELIKENIQYSLLAKDSDGYTIKYGERFGVSLLTIESALGLDFEAVILCGLLPMGNHQGATTLTKILQSKNEMRLKRNETFFKCINQIYTGCTRARNYLYIVLTEDYEKNLYSKIIIDAWKGGTT